MWRLTLGQMRRSIGRLSAAGLAIVIGTAFVGATLIGGAVITRTSYNALAASYADADLVVSPGPETNGLTPADLVALHKTPGVRALDGTRMSSIDLSAGAKHAFPQVNPVASDHRLEVQRLVSGTFPARPHEVALPDPLAKRLGVGLGGTVTTSAQVWMPAPAGKGSKVSTATSGLAEPAATSGPAESAAAASPAEPAGTWRVVPEQLTVVGLLNDPAGAFAQSGGAVVVTAKDDARWATQGSRGEPATYSHAVVVLATGANIGRSPVRSSLPPQAARQFAPRTDRPRRRWVS
jgi:putative ABC transport system permease protein